MPSSNVICFQITINVEDLHEILKSPDFWNLKPALCFGARYSSFSI